MTLKRKFKVTAHGKWTWKTSPDGPVLGEKVLSEVETYKLIAGRNPGNYFPGLKKETIKGFKWEEIK